MFPTQLIESALQILFQLQKQWHLRRDTKHSGGRAQGSNWAYNTEQAFLQVFPIVHNEPHLDTSRCFLRGMVCIPKVRQEKFLCEHKWHGKVPADFHGFGSKRVKLKYFKHSSGYPTCFGIENYQKPPTSQAEARYFTISRRYYKDQRYLLKKSIPET